MNNTVGLVDQGQLVSRIERWGQELGFAHIGFSGIDLADAEPGLLAWLEQGFHGDMAYMAAHGLKRARPAELVPGTVTVLTARLNYLTTANSIDDPSWQAIEFDRLHHATQGVISLYARGRDYHKVVRQRLARLAERIAQDVGGFGHRAFTDSAPVLEVELAARSGQGWRGKHTLVLNREAGSMFFLGEIYLDLALPPSSPVRNHCGSCNACIDVCPTGAIVAPYRLDARRCISYLTIEHPGSIAPELRPLMGNRIYGCDDCQLACPWNKFAQTSTVPDFAPRAGLVGADLVDLFAWTQAEFLQRLEGSPIRRIGHERWLRNIAIAMGNALAKGPDMRITQALRARAEDPSPVVREHVAWALGYHRSPPATG
ncbi:MAG: tRNA epoxyqueuosine(34) reductase QueG [Burkholderiaceae bacterium]